MKSHMHQDLPVDRNLAWLGAVVRKDLGFSFFFSGVSSGLDSDLASWGFSWTGALLLFSSFLFFLSRSTKKTEGHKLRKTHPSRAFQDAEKSQFYSSTLNQSSNLKKLEGVS